MCGITGYIGKRDATPILIEGLKKLEYRGYDSAGIALLKKGKMTVCKKKGRVDVLAGLMRKNPFKANLGISHTRWATHGGVTDANAHPHVSSDGMFALVHNGIIENYESMKRFLIKKGYTFSSQTDSEALVNLIAYHYQYRTSDKDENRFLEAVRKALIHVEGTYGIAVLCKDRPDELVAARKGSPLLIGIGKDERLVSSDVLGFAGRANNVIYLDDGQVASITKDNCDIISINYYSRWSPELDTYVKYWGEWADKPFLVTEFYTKGIEDSDLPNSSGAGFAVPTETDRAYAYQHFTLGLLEAKNCVGWHWFKYQDDAPEDNSGQGCNKGIFDNDYKMYQKLARFMKAINLNVYELTEFFDNNQ